MSELDAGDLAPLVGADGIFAEMCDLILPAMRSLEDALQFAGGGGA